MTKDDRRMRWLLIGLIAVSAAVLLKVLAACILPLEFALRLNRWLLSLDLLSYLDPEPLIRRLFGTLEGPAGELLRQFLENVSRTFAFQAVRWAAEKLNGLAGGPVQDALRWSVPAMGLAALLQEVPTVWALLCGWIFRGSLLRGGRPAGLRGLRVLCWIRLILRYLALRNTERLLSLAVLPLLAWRPGLLAAAAVWMLTRVGYGLLILFDAEVIRAAGLLGQSVWTGQAGERISRVVPIGLILYALASLVLAAAYALPGFFLFALSHLALAAGCAAVAVSILLEGTAAPAEGGRACTGSPV